MLLGHLKETDIVQQGMQKTMLAKADKGFGEQLELTVIAGPARIQLLPRPEKTETEQKTKQKKKAKGEAQEEKKPAKKATKKAAAKKEEETPAESK